MSRYLLGNELPPALQEEAKSNDKYRFTGEHRPAWIDGSSVSSDVRNGQPQFDDDAQWLANTEFPVAGEGPTLHLARNKQKPRTTQIRTPINGAGDKVTPQMAEDNAIVMAKRTDLYVWVQVEGQRVGDMTFNRPNIGLPHMWRVATPKGEFI